jgi:hypothetical protein
MGHFHKQILKKETGKFISNGPIKIVAARPTPRKLGHKDRDHEMQNCTTNQIWITVDIAISIVVSFLRSVVRLEIIICLHIFGI